MHTACRFAGILLIGLCAGSTACVYQPPKATREASFASYRDAKIKDNAGAEEPARAFLLRRTAIIFNVGEAKTTSGNSAGAAAAIDPRGYFLTAAHAVPATGVVHLLMPRRPAANHVYSTERAEIVWRGDRAKGEADLALLYLPRPPAAYFEWAPHAQEGSAVLATGTNFGSGGAEFVPLGGRLLEVSEPSQAASKSVLLAHDAPLQRGDSGGPLVNADGRLLGINYAVDSFPWSWIRPRSWSKHAAFANRPDVAWFRELIDRDYVHRSKQGDPAAFWARPDPAGHLAGLLIARTRELETRRLHAGAPDDKRAAFDRQELILKTFSAETGLTDEFASLGIVSEIPRTAPGEPTPASEIEKLAAFLRTLLDLN